MFVCLSHLPRWRRKKVQCSGDRPCHQTHHFALIVQYLILHACSRIFALDYFHEILVLASALFYHFLLSVKAKKNIICSLQKKNKTKQNKKQTNKQPIQQHRAHNPTYLPGQVYFLVWVVIVPIIRPYVLPAIHTGTGKPSRTWKHETLTGHWIWMPESAIIGSKLRTYYDNSYGKFMDYYPTFQRFKGRF